MERDFVAAFRIIFKPEPVPMRALPTEGTVALAPPRPRPRRVLLTPLTYLREQLDRWMDALE